MRTGGLPHRLTPFNDFGEKGGNQAVKGARGRLLPGHRALARVCLCACGWTGALPLPCRPLPPPPRCARVRRPRPPKASARPADPSSMSDDEEAVPSMSAAVRNEAVLAVVATDGAEIVAKRAREDPERFRPAVISRLKRAKTGLDETIACFECPISQAGPMVEPVQAADGNSYEKAAYMRWLDRCKEEGKGVRSPLTNEQIRPWFSDNLALRKTITGMVESGLIPESQLAATASAPRRPPSPSGSRRPDRPAPAGEHAAACRSLMHLYGNGNLVVFLDGLSRRLARRRCAATRCAASRRRAAGHLGRGGRRAGHPAVHAAAAEGGRRNGRLVLPVDDEDDVICLDGFDGAARARWWARTKARRAVLELADRRRTDGTTPTWADQDGPEQEMEFWRGEGEDNAAGEEDAVVPAPVGHRVNSVGVESVRFVQRPPAAPLRALVCAVCVW